MSGALKGSIAWVTGASSGIGLACARVLGEQGATVLLSARDSANLERTAEELRSAGLTVQAVPVDVVDEAAVHAAAGQALEQFGGIDILVNSAGLNVAKRTWADVAPADWNRVFEVNVNGTYHCIRAVLPVMRERGGGLVINIASWAGRFTSGKAGPATTRQKARLSP